MLYIYFITIVVILYMLCDLNYLFRTLFTVCSGRFYQKQYNWNDATTIYGLSTFQDCDLWFKSIRLDRLLRDLDFARYHFYDRTGIYRRSRQYAIKSLQGSTLTISLEPIPLFTIYKIVTKLVYWDERSLFLEHEIVTIYDNKVRCILLSRQFALGKNKESTSTLLLDGLPGPSTKPDCPGYVISWLDSMKLSSKKLRN